MKTALSALLICAAAAQTMAVEQSPAKAKLDCPNVKLLRHATKEERKLSTTPDGEPFFFSEHYCFAYVRPFTQDNAKLPIKYHGKVTSNISTKYHTVYHQLRSDEQKLAFIHLFIATLTQRAAIYPNHTAASSPSILVPTHVRGTGYQFDLITDEDPRLMLDKLADIQVNPPQEKDHPKLMALVLQVLDASQRITAESVQDQLIE
ncbi:MAG: hypothetical protein MJK04_17130 [Psychrosphaera sp.]|nr:hypothetical protein [Psychrosphaera sp.]